MTDEDRPYRNLVDHSHSRVVKLVDELLGVASAIEENGTFESHHRGDMERFAEQLADQVEGHVQYEENELFPAIDDRVDDEARDAIDLAVEQHRELEDRVAAFSEAVETVEEGDDAGGEKVGRIIREAEAIHALVNDHDEVEERIFASLEPDEFSDH